MATALPSAGASRRAPSSLLSTQYDTHICPPQVPAAVRRDLESLAASSGSAAVLVKEAATIAKYRLPGLAATLEVRRMFL